MSKDQNNERQNGQVVNQLVRNGQAVNHLISLANGQIVNRLPATAETRGAVVNKLTPAPPSSNTAKPISVTSKKSS